MSKLPATPDAASLPAVIDETDDYVAFEEMVEMAEYVMSLYDDVNTACRDSRFATAKLLESAKDELEFCEDEGLEAVANFARQLERFDPKDAYDSKGAMTKAQVSKHLGFLIASFGGARPTSSFNKRLLNEVLVTKSTVPALESACRQVIRSSEGDFMPGIGKVVAAVKEQNEIWRERCRAIDNYADAVQMLRLIVAEMTRVLAAEELQREKVRAAIAEEKCLRAMPLVVGDRVQHDHMGRGSIVSKASYEDAGFTVLFDHGEKTWILTDDLARLIPGDAGFEITEAESEAAAKKAFAVRQKRIEATMELMENLNRRPVAGDRVRNSKYGYGTVTWNSTDDLPDGVDGVIVHFDDDDSMREMPVDRLGVCGAIEVPIDMWELDELPEDDGFGWPLEQAPHRSDSRKPMPD